MVGVPAEEAAQADQEAGLLRLEGVADINSNEQVFTSFSALQL